MAEDKRIYTVATAHLDTVWNWDLKKTISEYLYNTLVDNFKLFEEYPEYKFNFEGAYRYSLMEEYYPELFEKLKEYVEKGKWNVAGSSWENGDVNVPSPETLFRNILYGNEYFDSKFGKRSKDIYLPDCFGFGFALPSVAAHANLLGFTTQKLTWGSAKGIPFDLGRWYGSDGKWIFASIDALSYTSNYKAVRKNKAIKKKLSRGADEGKLAWTQALHGTGDIGGAPKEESIKTVVAESLINNSEKTQVYIDSVDKIFRDLDTLTDDEKFDLPAFKDELVMTKHGVGSYTSRAFGKRMNRRNEEIADMAERAAVESTYLTGSEYPKAELDTAWKRVINHTFHDDITGTSLQEVYVRSWNDLIVSANQFSNVYEGASQQIIKNLDTSWVKGTAVVLNNSLEQNRVGVAEVILYGEEIQCVRAYDEAGNEYPCQIQDKEKEFVKVVFAAEVPSMGYEVFDLRICDEVEFLKTDLRITDNTLENEKYFVQVDENGNICSIIDKTMANMELLKRPIGFHVMLSHGGKEYPAWEIEYQGVKGIPWEFAGQGETEIIERGPARVTLKVTQKTDHADYTFCISLFAGGKYVEVQNEVDWRTTSALLKNRFCFTASSKTATFDLGLGAIERKKRNKKLYEVPAQKWADISDDKHYYGVSVFSDSKYGWDKVDRNTIRLTAIHTPKGNFKEGSMQSMMDLGLNRYGYAIYSHYGSFENGTQFYARCFDRPLGVFVTDKHVGSLGGEYSFGNITSDNVIVRAIKKAENSNEIIVRVNEGANKTQKDVKLALGEGIATAREVYASEEEFGPAEIVENRLSFSLAPYEVKTFALTLKENVISKPINETACELPFNADVVTFNASRDTAFIPSKGVSIPAELLPDELSCGGVKFKTARTLSSMNNALICNGQVISVDGDYLSIMAASLNGDDEFEFTIDDSICIVPVQAIDSYIGCWDLYGLEKTAYIKKDKVAWECTHTHSAEGDNVGNQLFFFRYDIPIKGAKTVKFPEGNNLIVLAATLISDSADTVLVSDLYDSVEPREFKLEFSEFQANRYEKQLKKVMHKKDYKARVKTLKAQMKAEEKAEKEQAKLEEKQQAEQEKLEKQNQKDLKKIEKQAKKSKKSKSKKDTPVEEEIDVDSEE